MECSLNSTSVPEESGYSNRHDALSLLLSLCFPALTVLFGLQALRVFLPGLVWTFGDRLGIGEPVLGAIAIVALLLIASLAGAFPGLWRGNLLVIATAGGLGLIRLFMQVFADSTIINVSLAMAGTALFVLFIPAYLWRARLSGGTGVGRFVLGMLVGLILDTAIHGGFHTYDISWQSGALPLLTTSLLAAVQWLLLAGIIRFRNIDASLYTDNVAGGTGYRVNPLALIAVGPFLFLQLVVLQNVARVATLADWALPTAFGLTLLAQIAGLGVAAYLPTKGYRYNRVLVLFSGIVLIGILAISHPEGETQTAVQLILGQVLLSLLIALVFTAPAQKRPRESVSVITIANGLGVILLLLFLMGYYVVYYFRLPYSNTVLETVAAFIVAACALVSPAYLGQVSVPSRREWLSVVLVLPLLVLPVVGACEWKTPATVAGDGYPVRVMTYNLHNGFNADGHLDMEAIAQEIEVWDADIIALQEISRGWAISGRLDMLLWLSNRLDIPYVFAPTADPFWGNAILSRYPVLEYKEYELSPRDLPVLRGFVRAVIDIGDGDRLQVIATHFHHVEGDGSVREIQVAEVIENWKGEGRTVLLGDLNADPHEPEMVMLQQEGLIDTVATLEPPPVYTWHANDPDRRIDYIWLSPDLSVLEVSVPMPRASDHLPVIALIEDLK
jgi:endonuclease/exonuclease/phosphatase family metal-dependent hydrolase